MGVRLPVLGTMVERFTRLNFGTLQIDVTIADPKAYTERDAGLYLSDSEAKQKAAGQK